MTVLIDRANITLHGNHFNYTKDPLIVRVQPSQSFASGGRIITVHGRHLDVVEKPQMIIYMEDSRMPINKTVSTEI